MIPATLTPVQVFVAAINPPNALLIVHLINTLVKLVMNINN